jgi:hypothetical protein
MNTTHKYRCEDCKAFFHQPKALEVTDVTGFVDLIVDVCPECNSDSVANNIHYYDRDKLKQRVADIIEHMEKIILGLSACEIHHHHKKSMIFISGYLLGIEHGAVPTATLEIAFLRSKNAKEFLLECHRIISILNDSINK